MSRTRETSRNRRRTIGAIESLEDRRLLSIAFAPQFGAEVAHDGGSDVLPDVPVYLIFWGSSWDSPNGPQTSQVIDATKTLTNSLYFSAVSQYRNTIGSANFAGYGLDFSDPSNGFTEGDIGTVVANAIGTHKVPDPYEVTPKPLFLVVTPPGVTSDDPLAGSYHGLHVVVHANPFDPIEFRYEGWIQDSANFDATTQFLSHEIVESITNPNAAGPGGIYRSLTVDHGAAWPGVGDDFEIADAEAQSYAYRINNVLAQSYWSEFDQAYIVPDDTAQTFFINPKLDNKFNQVGGTLTIRGDQLKPNGWDQILIDATPDGRVQVKLNGETATFEKNQVTSIVVDAKGGLNQIFVAHTLASAPIKIITGSDTDLIWIGDNGDSSQGIKGSVSVVSTPTSGKAYIQVTNSGDATPDNVTLDDHSVTGLASASISWDPAHLGSLTLYSSQASDQILVKDTPDNAGHPLTTINTGRTGKGHDGVVVRSTHGPLDIDSGSNRASVSIGFPFPQFGLSVTSGIHGPVNVETTGFGGSASLTIDDHHNNVPRVATLGNGSLTGFSPAKISWVATSVATGGVTDVTILGGDAGNTFTITDTSKLFVPLTLKTGGGNDSVNVWGSTGAIKIDGVAGQDSFTAGAAGNVDSLKGKVTVSNSTGSTQATLYDNANATPKNATLSTTSVFLQNALVGYATTVSGFAPGSILLNTDLSGAKGVNALSVFGGKGGNTFTATNLGPFSFPVTLASGGGNDTVYVPSTTSALNIDGAGGNDSVILGRTAALAQGDISKLKGGVTVKNTGGSTTLTLDDASDATFHAPILYSGAVSALAPTDVLYTPVQVVSLRLRGGPAANIYNVVSTPSGTSTTITGGLLNDVFNVGNNTDGLDEVQGAVTVNGSAGTDVLNVKDAASAQVHFGILSNSSLFVTHVAPLNFATIEQMNVTLGKASEQFAVVTPVPTFPVSVQAGTGVDTLAGPNVSSSWTIKGTNAGTLGNVSFSGFPNLRGGTSGDVFQLQPSGKITGTLDGGGAPAGTSDWLDYSLWSTSVSVNLTNGSATNVGAITGIQGVLGGFGADALIGGVSPSILVGNAGNDKLTAGAGRALLIGGAGVDTISGGLDDDLLIGGTTAYNANTTALDAVIAEWSLTNTSYLNRIAAIRKGVGPKQQYKLDSTTVVDDLVVDVIFGKLGNDWFWGTPSGPKQEIMDRAPGEMVN